MRDVTSLTNGVMSYQWYSSFIALLGWDVLHHLISPLNARLNILDVLASLGLGSVTQSAIVSLFTLFKTFFKV